MSGDNEGAKASEYQSTYAPDSVYQPAVDTTNSDETTAQSTYQSVYGKTGTASPDSGSSSSSDDGGSSVELNDPGFVKYPALKMAYTTAPHLEPFPASSGDQGGNSPAPPELDHPVSIDLAALLATETSFLTATKTLVDDYENSLVPEVKAALASTTLFGQNVTMTSAGAYDPAAHQGGTDDDITSSDSGLTYDALDQSGTDFANAINPQMSKLLQSIGDVIETLGQFTASINQAGQLYASADKNSAFPAASEMSGPTVPQS